MKNVWIQKAKEEKEKKMNNSLKKTFEQAIKNLYDDKIKVINFKPKKN